MKTLISSEYGLTISGHVTVLRQWLSEKNTDYIINIDAYTILRSDFIYDTDNMYILDITLTHDIGIELFSRKGPSATGFSPISRYMEDFGEEQNVLGCQKYFVVDGPSPFSEAGSVTHEKSPSNEIDRVITMEIRRP